MSSAALFRASNLLAMDYPFGAALASALRICDEAVVVVGQSEDDTLPYVRRWAAAYPGRVIVHETVFTFDRMWQQRWWELAASLTSAEWLLWLDADEVIAREHAPALRRLMQDDSVRLIRFPFVHLYATPRWHMARGFLTHNTRLGRRSAGYAMVNLRHNGNIGASACAMMVTENGRSVDAHHATRQGLVTVDTPILHYGWCRHAQALAISQAKHYAWYDDGAGLEDGHLPDVPPLDFRLSAITARGRVTAYAGEHDRDLLPWFAAHEDAWAELEGVTA